MFSSNASQVSAANYIEDVFSTYLYTGTASAQTITNGIDLSGKGGMVWLKSRSGADSHYIVDTARGSNKVIYSDLTIAEETLTRFSSFNSNGFSLSTTPSNPNVNGYTYASWTFRKQAKFFDVVTYTGNGVAGRTVAHNLGSAPGCMIVKRTDGATNWRVYHRSLGATQYLDLDETVAAGTATTIWNDTAPTATVFSVGTNSGVNANGGTYVAYLFAHDAGGFGAAGTDNVISCGSFTKSAGVEATITLGYEPQWLLFKRADAVENWFMIDNMRGMTVGGTDAYLIPNLSSAENNLDFVTPTSTGFIATNNFNTGTYIYIAIRRGPMKPPTSGTSVFSPVTRTGTNANASITTNFPVDFGISRARTAVYSGYGAFDRLRGNVFSYTPVTDAEYSGSTYNVGLAYDSNTAMKVGPDANQSFINGYDPAGGYTGQYSSLFFRRAPGFFDVVCYNGNGTNRTINHNLGVTPELIIVKSRLLTSPWSVYSAALANTERLVLNTTAAKATVTTVWNSTSPTASVFSLGTSSDVNSNYGSGAATFVAYLFATVAGVSKVGSYTGTAALQTINCGFSAGARFVLIKRTDSTGDWYVWDSARGISSGNDPYLLLNSTAAEVTGTNYVDTTSVGFQVTAAAPAGINASGGSYIFLAVA